MDPTHHNPGTWRIGQIIAYLNRLHASRTDRMMERIGLYRGQAILLITLAERDGLTHSEAAERLEISPAAATKVIRRMAALRYITRRPDPADERISRVFLTTEGWAMIQKIKEIFAEIDQVLLAGLSPDEQAALIALMGRVYTNLYTHQWPSEETETTPGA